MDCQNFFSENIFFHSIIIYEKKIFLIIIPYDKIQLQYLFQGQENGGGSL